MRVDKFYIWNIYIFLTQYPIVVLSGSRYERLFYVIKDPVSYHCNRAIQDRTIFQPVHNEIKIVTTSIFT